MSVVLRGGQLGHQLAFINGSTLKALRECRGASSEYLCKKAAVKPEQLASWEQCSDSDYPTMKQAEKIAKALLIPLAGLYLDPKNLPEEKIPSSVNKRRIRNAYTSDESASHLAVCKLAQIRADAIEIADEADVDLPEFATPSFGNNNIDAASSIHEWMEYSLKDQKRARSSRKFYLALRARLEERGVLVAQFDGVEVEELRGVALYYEKLPVIGVNAKDHWPAKCFSVLHELVHLSNRSSTYCNLIGEGEGDEEEVFCNSVAGEFLFSQQCAVDEVAAGLDPHDVGSIEKVAKRYSVSRDVVARRLHDCGYLDKSTYEELLDVFARHVIEMKEEERRKRELGENVAWGESRERTAADSLGSLYCELISLGLSSGFLSERDACDAFGVESEKLGKVFEEAII